MIIKSKNNSNIKEINKLKQKKYRLEKALYIAEGKKIVEEAIMYQKDNIVKIFASVSFAKKNNIGRRVQLVEDEIFKYITEDKNPEGIIAVLRMPQEVKIDYNDDEIAILNEIRDPGNMGTIIRTLDALGKKQVIITGDSVDPYMPKVVRASMGGIFRLNIAFRKLHKEIIKLTENNYEVCVADMNGENIYKLNKGKYAIIFNNESKGLSKEVENDINKAISIPMSENTESLNVAVSLSLIMYEFYRKRNFD